MKKETWNSLLLLKDYYNVYNVKRLNKGLTNTLKILYLLYNKTKGQQMSFLNKLLRTLGLIILTPIANLVILFASSVMFFYEAFLKVVKELIDINKSYVKNFKNIWN